MAMAAESAAQYNVTTPEKLSRVISKLEKEMKQHAQNLEFEAAAQKRDEIRKLRERMMVIAA